MQSPETTSMAKATDGEAEQLAQSADVRVSRGAPTSDPSDAVGAATKLLGRGPQNGLGMAVCGDHVGVVG